MHLVIATRSDPPLPLARLRARGELCEIRAEDLRFTEAEASAFFQQTIGLALSSEEVTLLSERTEGWMPDYNLRLFLSRIKRTCIGPYSSSCSTARSELPTTRWPGSAAAPEKKDVLVANA
jgi:hypothetical protein